MKIDVHALPPFEIVVVDDIPENEMHLYWEPNSGPHKHLATFVIESADFEKAKGKR